MPHLQLTDARAACLQMNITNNHWDETGPVMTALKRMIKQIMR